MEIQREDCTYTASYCNENVWWLCDSVKKKFPEEIQYCYCVYISNEQRATPIWKQKASHQQDGQVVWDYHVIFLYQTSASGTLVYDLDTTLTFPCDLKQYYEEAIKDNKSLKPEYHRMFRVIPATEYLKIFASDRLHMLTPDGRWKAPPPPYPPIKTEECSDNLQEFISMEGNGHGVVLGLSECLNRFLNS
uniref:Protein N-terminal glutamine amidohydrolase n=1 Tax=Magallana gigas TaxID=29159 RepID=A0A8W8P2Y8_MAGGI|nr:protein N-terminal glutamine amidohydrolase [Crassostrea gigas]